MLKNKNKKKQNKKFLIKIIKKVLNSDYDSGSF